MSKVNSYSNEEQFADSFSYPSAERPSIHYVEGPKRTCFHRSTKKANFLDVVMVNSSNNVVLVHGSEFTGSTSSWGTNNPDYLPIGIVVIPSGVLPDGRARMMSLTDMSKTNAASGIATGGNRETLKWGDYSINLPLKDYSQIPCLSETGRAVISANTYAYLPSDKISSNYGNILDKCDNQFKSWYSQDNYHAPSPFSLIDKNNKQIVLNRLYSVKSYFNTSTTSTELITNPLSDFNGFKNTRIILNTHPISPSYVEGDSSTYVYEWTDAQGIHRNPLAFLMTKQFHTNGTNAGDWYIPSIGEIGFILPRFNEINKILGNTDTAGLWKHYGLIVPILPLNGNTYYWSSTECEDGGAYDIGTGYGLIFSGYKGDVRYVRAFAFLP